MNTDFQHSTSELAYKLTIDNHTNARAELEVEATLEEWMNFMREKNAAGVLSIYAEEATNFDLMAPLEYHGPDAIQDRLETWFSSFTSDIILDVEDLHIRAEGGTAFAHCLIRFMGDKANDDNGEDMYNRVTFGFEKIDNDWLIVHQHSSLPFDMKSGKVLLDLKPNLN